MYTSYLAYLPNGCRIDGTSYCSSVLRDTVRWAKSRSRSEIVTLVNFATGKVLARYLNGRRAR